MFKSIIEFNAKEWYYLDSDRNQHGPVVSRMLIHKLRQQEIDGMSLVYGGGLTEWKQVSEVPELKNEMMKINQEEQAAEEAAAAAAAAASSIDVQHQIFAFNSEDDIIPPYSMPVQTEKPTESSSSSTNPSKKSFVADNGIRYGWDEEEQDWVELDDDEDLMDDQDENSDGDDYDDEDGTNRKGKKRKAAPEPDSDEAVPESDSAAAAAVSGDAASSSSAAAPPKKKRSKRKPKKAPNTWIYVTGLPANVTFEEIRDHFSKVRH